MGGERARAGALGLREPWSPVAAYGWQEGDRAVWRAALPAGDPLGGAFPPPVMAGLAPGRRLQRPVGDGVLRAVGVGPRLSIAVLLGPRGYVPPWGQQVALASLWERRLRVLPSVIRPPAVPARAFLVRPLRRPEDVAAARASLHARLLRAAGDPERALRACVAATEAMINAVRHGGGGEVRAWEAAGRLWVRVEDAGPGLAFHRLAEALLRPRPDPGSGHGYWLMLAYARCCRVEVGGWGTCVTLAFALPRQARDGARPARAAAGRRVPAAPRPPGD